MASVQVLYWKDIPLQVRGRVCGRGKVSIGCQPSAFSNQLKAHKISVKFVRFSIQRSRAARFLADG